MAGKYAGNILIMVCISFLSLFWAGSGAPFAEAAAATATATEPVVRTAVVTAGGGLNVRSGPGTGHAIIGHALSGARLPVVDVSGDWVRVKPASGDEGWVAGWYVKIEENTAAASAPEAPEPVRTAVVTTEGGLNVRSGPGTSHAIITHAALGKQFPVVDTSGHWVRVELAGDAKGWVAGWLVRVESSPSAVDKPAPPPAEPPAPEDEEALPSGRKIVVDADGLDIKNGPNGTTSVAYVTSGTTLPVTARSGSWYKVELPTGSPGWVPEAEVSLVREDQPSRGTAEKGGTADGRSGPGVENRVIVLDPGHGGEDPGATGPTGLKEKDFNLAVALEAARLLRAEGAEVILTRDTDIRLGRTATEDCQARSRIANERRADIFVSIHANANLNPASEGTSVYFHAHPENHADCVRLARELQTSLVHQLGRRDLGLFGSNLLVLRGIDMPGALIETAFISNYEEEALLRQEAFQQGAAKGITDGIKAYFGD